MNYYIIQNGIVKKFKNKENFIMGVKKTIQDFSEEEKKEIFNRPFLKNLYKSLQLSKVYEINVNALKLFEDFAEETYFLSEEDYLKWQKKKGKYNE